MPEGLKNNRIAVYTNGWSTEFNSLLLAPICECAKRDGIDVFIFTSYILWGEAGDTDSVKLNIYKMADPGMFDGVISFTNTLSAPTESQTMLSRFSEKGVPILSVEQRLPGAAYIGTGNHKGMYDLGCHLISVHDVKRIVYVKGAEGNEECAERKAALEEALDYYGLKLAGTISGQFSFYNAASATGEWIDEGNPLPDAFVCANDLMAMGVVSKLNEKGINVPDDVIVTGFDHIAEAQTSYPLIATVTRDWEKMGEKVYKELLNRIKDPDPEHETEFDTRFVPTESCGCPPSAASIKKRYDKMRNLYTDNIQNDMVEFMFQEIRGAMMRVETTEQFHEVSAATLTFKDYIGSNHCLCTDPQFFACDDSEYTPGHLGYPDEMEVLFERVDGKPTAQRMFYSKEIYPGYRHKKGKSQVFVITALNHMDYNIGYVAIKDRPQVLYDLRFKKWVNNMDTLLVTIRQYMISQRLNRRLQNIYLTDYLTNMYNRTGCEEIMFKFVDDERRAGRNSLLLFTDIDGMKSINDEHGHINGDLAIKATAEAMNASLPEGWITGRYGGDEFIAAGPDDGSMTIEKYRRSFKRNLKKVCDRMKLSFVLNASAGYCLVTPDTTGTIEDFIRTADISMYEQKEIAHNKKNHK